ALVTEWRWMRSAASDTSPRCQVRTSQVSGRSRSRNPATAKKSRSRSRSGRSMSVTSANSPGDWHSKTKLAKLPASCGRRTHPHVDRHRLSRPLVPVVTRGKPVALRRRRLVNGNFRRWVGAEEILEDVPCLGAAEHLTGTQDGKIDAIRGDFT